MEEVIQLKPDVILAPATFEAVAAKRATNTIPIVCAALADAIHLGLIASEARPGGNVTGIEPYIAGLPAKQIELAREIVPGARKIGLLTNQGDPKRAAPSSRSDNRWASLGASDHQCKCQSARKYRGCAADAGERKGRRSNRASNQSTRLEQLSDRLSTGEATADGLWLSRARHNRRTDQLRCRFAVVLSSRGILCDQNPAGHCTQRAADRIPNWLLAGSQFADREVPRHYRPADTFGPRRRGDRMRAATSGSFRSWRGV